MTVVAAEAAAGGAAGSASAARAAGGAGSARGPASAAAGRGTLRPAAAKTKTSGAAGRPSRAPGPAPSKPAPGRTARKKPPTAMRRQDESGQAWLQRQSEAPPPTAEIVPGSDGRYRRIVIAEFVGTVVLVGASPFLKPRKANQTPAEAAASFTLATPLVRLTAVCLVFFVLALLANGPRSGRIAAAFGGLVMVGAALNATTALQGLTAVMTKGPASAAGQAVQAVQGEQIGSSAGAGAGLGAGAAAPDEGPVGRAF